jgi:hypothetical protein
MAASLYPEEFADLGSLGLRFDGDCAAVEVSAVDSATGSSRPLRLTPAASPTRSASLTKHV